MRLIQRVKCAYIAVSALMMACGILLIAFPEISVMAVCYIVGTLVTIFGIVKLVGYFSKDLFRLAFQFDFAFGILTIIAGILILLHPDSMAHVAPELAGVIVLVDGAFRLQTAYDAKQFGMKHWWMLLLLAVITGLCGMFLILRPLDGAVVLMVLIGCAMFVDGIQNLCVAAYTVKSGVVRKQPYDEQ